MATAMTCDSCGKTIDSFTQRTQIIMPSTENIAGSMIDLCSACSDAVVKDAKVRKADENFKKRMTTPTPPKG